MLIAYSLTFACVLAINTFTLHTFICFFQLHVEAGRRVQRALFCPQTTLATTPRASPVCMRSQCQESSVRNTLSTWPQTNISECQGLLIADPMLLLSRTYVCCCEKNPFSEKKKGKVIERKKSFFLFISENWCSCNWIGTVATNEMCICVCFCKQCQKSFSLNGFLNQNAATFADRLLSRFAEHRGHQCGPAGSELLKWFGL